MKTNRALITMILLFFLASSGRSQVLNVSSVTQEQDQWCWAGVSACVLQFYCAATPQCNIAEYTRTVATWHNFGTTNCCVNASLGCNYWNYSWGYPGSIQDILIHFANIQNFGVGSCFSQATITSQIVNNQPFIIRWGWTSGGGHFLVGHGQNGNSLYYMDPWYGEGLKIADYSWVVSGSNHTWTHTNQITTPSPKPYPAGSISGPATVCKGETGKIYSVPVIPNATGYTWTLPSGASIVSGSNTNTITVNFSASATSGNITVYGTNTCGNGATSSSFTITLNVAPVAAGSISGPTVLVPGQSGVVYTVPSISNATGYAWTLPAGASITAGLNTNSITVAFSMSASSGCISVHGTNASCSGQESSCLNVSLGHTISGQFLYDNTANTPLPTLRVYLKQNGLKIDSTTTDILGNYTFSGKANGTYTISAASQIPWAGVNGTDALKIQRHFAGLELLTEPVRLHAGDVNNSGAINGTDALKVMRRFVGMDFAFDRGDWVFEKPVSGGDTIIVDGTNVIQNFYGLFVGDVNGSGF